MNKPEYGPAGAEFYESVVKEFDLSPSEEAALDNAAHVLDYLDELHRGVDEHGVITPSGRPSPLLAEIRQQEAILVRLLGLLALPSGGDEDDNEATASSGVSRAARAAARARWQKARGRY